MVFLQIPIFNQILKSQNFSKADVYYREDFRTIIASNTLMTNALIEGANRALDNFNELHLVINKKRKQN